MFSLPKTLKNLLLLSSPKPSNLTLKSHYIDVKMKWKKDPFYDSIDPINKTQLLKPLISLKNIISSDPDRCIPISAVSKLKYQLDTPTKVSIFLRQYPSFFQEFTPPNHNLPWFRLTPEAAHLDLEERAIYRNQRSDLVLRLKKLLLMTKEKTLPLDIIKGIQWYLGLPDDFLQDPEADEFDGSFEFVDLEDGVRGLRAIINPTVEDPPETSFLERRNSGDEPIQFPLFPSKGLRLKKKIEDWLQEFQKLPYISPYRDFSDLKQQRRDSDVWEKRVVGVLHELLCLFVDHAAERRRLRCLRTYLALPQKFGEAFVRHPHIFYLSLKGKTCCVILKEAYVSGSNGIEEHPIRKVREKYVELMHRSKLMLKDKRDGGKVRCGSDGDLVPTLV
ncbi:protein ROOT PRIMORDIUM DEFECTIVE 1 isoform X1 [Cinnamomum micranthum f. kanehirae]|uniref:Protein ROOT PRIMORDIUM DEFECTIVE 1 isoform X1 n=1 Tax=Cinnamomum micranthum f. kanehirae TaxID=337451 RepID=A0A3S3NHV8_9MAGN|nr:protein ROOT PRIMORDIUM DEFECTIVE 1 isoform X1 [Cinnamomum micranthum f. kanehirae]